MDKPIHFMVPFSKNEHFIRRSQKIARLKDKLVGCNVGGHRRLALWGLGGVGYVEVVQ